MSQHIHHHSNQTHYVHYNPTPQVPPPPPQQQHQVITHVAPKDTQRQTVMHQQQQQHYTPQGTVAGGAQASGSGTTNAAVPAAAPLVAKGDWTKDLVQLAKTAELKYVSVFFYPVFWSGNLAEFHSIWGAFFPSFFVLFLANEPKSDDFFEQETCINAATPYCTYFVCSRES